MRDAAGEFDDLKPALDVTLAVGENLAMLHRQHVREAVDLGLNQRLEGEHDACAALRVGRRPRRLGGDGVGHRRVDIGGAGQRHLRLDQSGVRIEDV